MRKVKDDGSVVHVLNPVVFPQPMSLRDFFAGQALANRVICDASTGPSFLTNAEYAYMMADAMLAERAKEKS